MRDGVDVVRFRIDVKRRRVVLDHRYDLPGVRRRPGRAAVAAPAGVVHQLSIQHITVLIGVRAVRIFSTTDAPQQHRRMPADGARPRIRGIAFAVELQERADQDRVLSLRVAIITFKRRDLLARHIRPAGRQFGIHRVAEVLRAAYSVGEIRDALQIAAVAVTRRHRAKRPVGFADHVEPSHQPAGARGVHGEVAGIFDRAFAHLAQVKRARPL